MASRLYWILIPILAMVLLAGLTTGCTKVAANYPPQSAPTPYIPEEYTKYKGESSPIVWDEPDELRAFLVLTQDFHDRAEAFSRLAEQSGSSVHRREAKEFADLAGEGLAMAYLTFYFAKDVKQTVETGDLELTFTDGTQCLDSGTVAANPGSMSQRFHSTRDGQITLSGKKLDRGEELIVWVLYDKANLRKKIQSIRLKADG